MRGGTLFCTLSGRPLSDRYVRNLLHHQADQANIAVGRCARPGRNCRRSDAISVSLPAHVLSLVPLSRGSVGVLAVRQLVRRTRSPRFLPIRRQLPSVE